MNIFKIKPIVMLKTCIRPLIIQAGINIFHVPFIEAKAIMKKNVLSPIYDKNINKNDLKNDIQNPYNFY